MAIHLNDILHLDDLENTRIRLVMPHPDRAIWNPMELFRNRDTAELLSGQYWNYASHHVFNEGQTTIGLVRLSAREPDLWLLFHIGRVTRDLDVLNGVGYEYEILSNYEQYFGRVIVRYHNIHQQLVRRADPLIGDLEVSQILPDIFSNDTFPGYEWVNLSWQELSSVIAKDPWRVALQNQKAVYLITDTSNNKHYVGSAYGANMLLGRWKNYVETGHGGNVGLQELSFDHIRNHFRYSILDIYKSTVEDSIILERENWWKDVFQSRNADFGYNQN